MGRDGEFDRPGKAGRERAEKYLFSRSLLGLVEHPRIGSEIDDDFAEGKVDELREFVEEHERALTKHGFLAEAIGAELVAWLRRDLLPILMHSCVEEESERLLRFVHDITIGLGQTAAGLGYLGALREREHMHSFMGYMFDGSHPLEGTRLQIATRGMKYYAGIFILVQKARLFNHENAISNIVHEIDAVFGALAPGWRSDLKVATEVVEEFALSPSPKSGPARRIHTSAKAIHGSRASLDHLGKHLGHADIGFKLLDALNVALALRQYFATNATQEDLRAKRGLAAVASGAGLLGSILDKTFDLAGRDKVMLSARIGVRALGFIAAAHTAALGYEAGKKAWDRGDYDAMVAVGVSTASTIAGGLMSMAATAGKAAWLGPCGAALAVAGGVGYLVYLYVRDSDFETLVLHCEYGRRVTEDPKMVPWSEVLLSELGDSWSMQSSALEAIQRQFAIGLGRRASAGDVKVTPFFKARIYTGHINADTEFQIVWRWRAKYGDGEEEQIWQAQAVSGSGTIEAFSDVLQLDGNDEVYFDVNIPGSAWRDCGYLRSVGQPGTIGYGYEFYDLKIEVRKRYKVMDGIRSIPNNGPIELMVQAGRQLRSNTSPAPEVHSIGD